MADMDWSEMEGLFCQQIPPSSAQSSPKLGNRDSAEVIERRMRKEVTEVMQMHVVCLYVSIFTWSDSAVALILVKALQVDLIEAMCQFYATRLCAFYLTAI